MDGVHAIIRREGFPGVTIDAVVAETGVAKTTIYRRYADRVELLEGVARALMPPTERDYPRTPVGLRDFVDDVRRLFDERVGVSAFGAIMADSGLDAQTWREGLVAPLITQLSDYFRAGVEEEILRPEVDYDLIIDMLLGGLFVADARHRQLPEGWAESVVDVLWARIAATRR